MPKTRKRSRGGKTSTALVLDQYTQISNNIPSNSTIKLSGLQGLGAKRKVVHGLQGDLNPVGPGGFHHTRYILFSLLCQKKCIASPHPVVQRGRRPEWRLLPLQAQQDGARQTLPLTASKHRVQECHSATYWSWFRARHRDSQSCRRSNTVLTLPRPHQQPAPHTKVHVIIYGHHCMPI